VDTIHDRFIGFHASKLLIVGRIVILNSIIFAMSIYFMTVFLLLKWVIYFMTVFLLLKWVIRAIDRIRRDLLWHGHKDDRAGKRGICLVNKRIIMMNKKYRGLGIKDIILMNYALITKWMWFVDEE
jgi:hypothetical protein